MSKPNYFLVAVSTQQHLELCLKYAVAGFASSNGGVCTFVEIQEGDPVSFLHAARAFNLHEVVRKEAIVEFQEMPSWPPVVFQSGKSYQFPFRLYLRPIREFCEPLVRPELAYAAENLLLRAGCRKTHFQADQTTLQNVSQMGSLWNDDVRAWKRHHTRPLSQCFPLTKRKNECHSFSNSKSPSFRRRLNAGYPIKPISLNFWQ